MVLQGFYLIRQSYVDKVNKLGGKYLDTKERPIYCCIEDVKIKGLFWAIPTSDVSHRSNKQIEKIEQYCSYSKNDIRSNYYHISHTNRAAIFKISSALPITEKYIEREYISQNTHLIMKNSQDVAIIMRKLYRILSYEGRFPNRLEQHITSIKENLENELKLEQMKANEKTIVQNQIFTEQYLDCEDDEMEL